MGSAIGDGDEQEGAHQRLLHMVLLYKLFVLGVGALQISSTNFSMYQDSNPFHTRRVVALTACTLPLQALNV